MTIIKSEAGKIFGGYTDIPWDDKGGNKQGNGNSFIFSFRDNSDVVKLRCLKKEYEVYHDSSLLCSFGYNGDGFRI